MSFLCPLDCKFLTTPATQISADQVEGPVTCSFFKNLCDAFGWKLLLLVGLAEITLKAEG